MSPAKGLSKVGTALEERAARRGAPLAVPGVQTLGTLCVTDTVPHARTKARLTALRVLGLRVIDRMRSFARGIQAGRVVVRIIWVIEDEIKITRETCPRNVQLLLVIDHHLWLHEADSVWIYQFYLNLCVNARDARPVPMGVFR